MINVNIYAKPYVRPNELIEGLQSGKEKRTKPMLKRGKINPALLGKSQHLLINGREFVMRYTQTVLDQNVINIYLDSHYTEEQLRDLGFR
jgi:hypothetical protein